MKSDIAFIIDINCKTNTYLLHAEFKTKNLVSQNFNLYEDETFK